MTENEKIKLVIEEYKEYLDNSNSDICHSIKGVWFIYLYDDVHDIYECFGTSKKVIILMPLGSQ